MSPECFTTREMEALRLSRQRESRNAGFVHTACSTCGEELTYFEGRLPFSHTCAECGGCLGRRRRADARYCSSPCRQRAYRKRKSGLLVLGRTETSLLSITELQGGGEP